MDEEATGMEAAAPQGPPSPLDQLRYAREIVQAESRTLAKVAARLDERFCQAVELIRACRGSVIVSGIGKAGLIGQKIAATLASTGTRSHYLHPAEAVHGDLGRVHADDVVLVLSQSGETEEVVRLLPSLGEMRIPLIAVTSRDQSTLGRAATVTIALGPVPEPGVLGLAPSASTTAMLAVGDALALVTSRLRNFGREDFARFHPGGSLGRQLSRVEQVMRRLEVCRVAYQERTVREVFATLSTPGRRTGAIMLVDGQGRLSGIFTDSDLARLFERRLERRLDERIGDVMTVRPHTVGVGTLAVEAVATMAKHRISELPVVDEDGRPVGLIDITDLLGLFPEIEPAYPSLTDGAKAAVRPQCRIFAEPGQDPAA